jgi:hypothetical protein
MLSHRRVQLCCRAGGHAHLNHKYRTAADDVVDLWNGAVRFSSHSAASLLQQAKQKAMLRHIYGIGLLA